MAEPEFEPVTEPESGEHNVIEVPVTHVVVHRRPRKVYAGMWGPLEIGAVAISSLAVVAALVVYFFFVIPSNRDLASKKSEADRLEAEQTSAKSKYGEITNTQDQVGKLLTSVDDFQARYLPATQTGQAALYQRINGLISAYDLTNTTGPDYTPLEAADLNNDAPKGEEDKGRAKFRSLFPGVYVSVTLEGSYQNLRRFIRDVETGREFIVVSAVELAPSDTEADKDKKKENNAAAPVQPGTAPAKSFGTSPVLNPTNGKPMQPMPSGFPAGFGQQPLVQTPAQLAQGKKGKMHGEVVSLHIELAAYFRRPGSAPLTTPPVSQ